MVHEHEHDVPIQVTDGRYQLHHNDENWTNHKSPNPHVNGDENGLQVIEDAEYAINRTPPTTDPHYTF